MSTLRNWRVASLRLYSSQPPTAFDEKLKTEFVARAARAKPLRPLPKVDNLSSTAAVLVPLVSVNGQPSLLFTARSWSLNTHRGEVCYPGGKFDARHDTCAEDTALRETEEELGIDRRQFQVWSKLPALPGRDGKSLITPVVALLKEEFDPGSLVLNPDEVAQVFTRQVSEFCSVENQGWTQFRTGYTLPLFFWRPDSPAPKIWGLTAVITHHVLSLLVPRAYKLRPQYVRPVH